MKEKIRRSIPRVLLAFLLVITMGSLTSYAKAEPVNFILRSADGKEILNVNHNLENDSLVQDLIKEALDKHKIAYKQIIPSIVLDKVFEEEIHHVSCMINGIKISLAPGDLVYVHPGDKLELVAYKKGQEVYTNDIDVIIKDAKGRVIVNKKAKNKLGASLDDSLKEFLDKNKIEYVDTLGNYQTSILSIKGYDDLSFFIDKENPVSGVPHIAGEDVERVVIELGKTYIAGFKDLGPTFQKDPYAGYAIQSFVERNIIKGRPGYKFAPNDNLTRAEFATILSKMLELEEIGKVDFDDVKENNWFYNEVQKVVEAGYMTGLGNGKFNPQGKITNQEVATAIYKIYKNRGMKFENENVYKLSQVKDREQISGWALEAVEFALDKGIVQLENGKFNPKAPITRAKVVRNLFTYEEIENEYK